MKFGYIGVYEDNCNIQRSTLEDYGVDKIYEEHSSLVRSRLYDLINDLQDGDIIIVYNLSTMFNHSQNLISMVSKIRSKGADIKSITDKWFDTTSDNSNANVLIEILDGLNKFDRELISFRTKQGLQNAKARGRNGGRPSKRSDKNELIQRLYEDNNKIEDIVKETGLSRATVYRAIRDLDSNKNK